ncbi:MAG: glycosyltransferase family protein [Candidatus Omnitrophota bacterium]|nr:glycosyltransferase family protein [Candidatus Omnitrophota bacterium]MDZ4242876.1 glycosyltransferase family protein [Candidatus Omnitrophota bacterium]
MSFPNIVAVIQARMGSSRLPQKSMMPLAGRPLVDHVMERAKKAGSLSQVVMAIPVTVDNDPIAERARALGVEVFRGSENDLVDRYYQAARTHQADVVVRMCADNPLIHPEEVDRIVGAFLKSDYDFMSNVGPVMGNNYPDGLGAEVFRFSCLEWIHSNIKDPRGREHVHENFYGHPDRFRLGTVPCPEEFAFPDIVLDINTKEEYDFIAKLFNDLSGEDRLITIFDIIPWYREHEHLLPPTYARHRDSLKK